MCVLCAVCCVCNQQPQNKNENTEPWKRGMGNSGSSSADPRYSAAARAFTQTKLDDLRSLYASLAAQSGSNGKYVSPDVFKAYIGIDGPLGDRVFDLVSQKRKDQRLTFEDLVIAKGTYEKGTNQEIEEFIYQILDVSDDGIVGRSDLEVVLTSIFNKLFHEQGSELKQIEAFVNAANPTSDSMSFEDFQKWCAHAPAVRKYLGSLLTPSNSGSQIPKLLIPDNIDRGHILLTKEYAWQIGGALSQADSDEWTLLYHSGVNGLSFNTFLGHMIKAPTLLVIKDKEGYVYGGYASQPWERHSDFYGDMRSFVFQFYPKTAIFRPTGANHNLQWFAVGFSSESIPNGIGFGGKAHHFGLFLSANFDQGHSFACTTFGSPSLSKATRIYPEIIECWGVVPRAQEDGPEGLKGSVLERFKEDRNMLNLVGLANSSQ